MPLTLVVPKYAHRGVSTDERLGRQIEDMLNPENPLPQKCSKCGSRSSAANPLVMKPLFRTEAGGPRGTMYQCFCAMCVYKQVLR